MLISLISPNTTDTLCFCQWRQHHPSFIRFETIKACDGQRYKLAFGPVKLSLNDLWKVKNHDYLLPAVCSGVWLAGILCRRSMPYSRYTIWQRRVLTFETLAVTGGGIGKCGSHNPAQQLAFSAHYNKYSHTCSLYLPDGRCLHWFLRDGWFHRKISLSYKKTNVQSWNWQKGHMVPVLFSGIVVSSVIRLRNCKLLK